MRLSAGGQALRLRFTNPFTYSPLVLTHVTVALAGTGTASLRGTVHTARVGGVAAFEVPPGAIVYTDPIPLATSDLETLAVSIYSEQTVQISKHDSAFRLSYATLVGTGDSAGVESGDTFRPFSTSWTWIDAVDVLDPSVDGAVATIGDSITDGAGCDFGTDTRWPDRLAERLLGLPREDPRRRAVINAGIGGNTLAALGTPIAGVNALARLDRDVLTQSGVREVIVFLGSNDIFVGMPAARVISGLELIADRIRQAGLGVLVCTLAPRMGGFQWDERREAERLSVNDWIRGRIAFDAVIDADAALRDPNRHDRLAPGLDADHTHPNTAGYLALADQIDLGLFSRVPTLCADVPPRNESQ